MIFLKIGLVAVFATCYGIGGQGALLVRRFLGPSIFAAGLVLLSGFKTTELLAAAFCFLPLALPGYGEKFHQHIFWRKVFIRAVHGLALGVPGLVLGLGHGSWPLGVLQLVLGALGSVYFGVFNPFAKYGDKGVFWEDFCLLVSATFLVPFI